MNRKELELVRHMTSKMYDCIMDTFNVHDPQMADIVRLLLSTLDALLDDSTEGSRNCEVCVSYPRPKIKEEPIYCCEYQRQTVIHERKFIQHGESWNYQICKQCEVEMRHLEEIQKKFAKPKIRPQAGELWEHSWNSYIGMQKGTWFIRYDSAKGLCAVSPEVSIPTVLIQTGVNIFHQNDGWFRLFPEVKE